MAVHVDKISTYATECVQPGARHNGTRWSHMWCDVGSEDDLHRIARAIGLKREWFQTVGTLHHYDLVPSKRALAILAGVQETSLRDWLRERRARLAVKP
jgi:hypothetical protein